MSILVLASGPVLRRLWMWRGGEQIAETCRDSFDVQSHFFTYSRAVGDANRILSFELKKSDYIRN